MTQTRKRNTKTQPSSINASLPIAVIGAGAAGLLASATAASAGQQVLLLEKNKRPGKKLAITGKGRCNITNNASPEELIAHTRTNPRFLYSAFHTFTAQDTMSLFTDLGLPLKTERGRRVFPQSDLAADVVKTLVHYAKTSGVIFCPQKNVTDIHVCDGVVTAVNCADGSVYPVKAVILATGGCSYPLTGSDGSGYQLAQTLGHTIIPPRPSLVPLLTHESWCADVAGLSLRNVTLSLRNHRGKVLFAELGELLFTHTGLSGPLVLSASAFVTNPKLHYHLSINLKPGLSPEQLDARLLRDFHKNTNRDFSNALGELLPKSLIPVLVSLSGIPPSKKVHSITREERSAFVRLIHALPLTVKGLGRLEEAVITSGGVCVREVEPKTMMSKKIQGLFFAGEILDVDAFTGGYNLQIAFSTGVCAGKSAAGMFWENGALHEPTASLPKHQNEVEY